ncbi:hypothetical protein [Fodinicola acaciae]|uniref:hypothetical protein n=1 Tax=Fodinicola acaciae TaxID=2681555 RepID=UPI0013D2C7FC|nr:hypothetical protein [Fodinicola acaciae]
MVRVDDGVGFTTATANYETALAAYVRAVNALDMIGLPLCLADPPYLTRPWSEPQFQSVRAVYQTLGRLLITRRAFEATRIATFNNSDRPRQAPVSSPRGSAGLVGPFQPGRTPATSGLPIPAPVVDLVANLAGPAGAYEQALTAYLAASWRRKLAGTPLGVLTPAHTTPIWTDEHVRATVTYREALCRLGVARRKFEQTQAPIIAAIRASVAEKATAARRERYRAEDAADQPY